MEILHEYRENYRKEAAELAYKTLERDAIINEESAGTEQ